MIFRKKPAKTQGLARNFEQTWFVQLDTATTNTFDDGFSFDPLNPPRLFSTVDFDSETYFRLMWTGNHWVDVPGDSLQDLLLNLNIDIRPVQKDFLEMFIPDAAEVRFPNAFISRVEEISKQSDPVALAEFISNKVHASQVDKSGMPYASHPMRVASLVQSVPGFSNLSDEQKSSVIQAAWLHDVLEDSGENGFPVVLQSDLYAWGISKTAVYATENLSRKTPLTRFLNLESNPDGYYEVINQDPLARMVKIADLADNCNLQRVELLKTLGVSIDPAKYPNAIQSLDFSADETNWFNEAIKKEVFDV